MPIHHRTYTTALTQEIRSQIVRGDFPPGSHLGLEILASQWDVSTMPIREALRVLEADGMVINVPHRGTFVKKYTPDELDDVYEIRAELEKLAMKSAVPRISKSSIALMREILKEIDRNLTDPVRLSDANVRFHSMIYEAAGRKNLCEMINRLRNSTSLYIVDLVAEDGVVSAQQDHYGMVECIERGDAEAAGKLAYAHIRTHGSIITRSLRAKLADEND